MVSYQPIRLNFEDLPNDFMIKTIAVVGNGLTALEKKKMALCGERTNGARFAGYLYSIPKTCPYEMWFVVCAGAKSIGETSFHMSTSVPSVKRRETQHCNFVRGILPPFDCRNKRSHSRLCTLQLLLFTNKIKW